MFFTRLLIPVTNFANYKCRASNNPGSNLHGSTNQKSISQGNKLCKSFAPFYKFKEDQAKDAARSFARIVDAMMLLHDVFLSGGMWIIDDN